jgi:hypothetical protein
MAKTDVMEKPVLHAVEKPRAIRPAALTWNHRGFAFNSAQVRLPEWADTADKLRAHPGAWSPVQNNPNTALSRLDELRLIAHDESWVAYAIVEDADRTSVKLAISKVIALEAKSAKWSDGTNEIRWADGGYRIYRVRDGVVISPMSFQTIDAARLELSRVTSPGKIGSLVG